MEKENVQNEFDLIDRSRVKELFSISIDTTLSVPERMEKYVRDGGDLRWRKKGDMLIKISHSGNGRSFCDNFIEMLDSM